jgi:hypothetical protein
MGAGKAGHDQPAPAINEPGFRRSGLQFCCFTDLLNAIALNKRPAAGDYPAFLA